MYLELLILNSNYVTIKLYCLCIMTGTYWEVQHVVMSRSYCSYFLSHYVGRKCLLVLWFCVYLWQESRIKQLTC